jgi:hypothetical protein
MPAITDLMRALIQLMRALMQALIDLRWLALELFSSIVQGSIPIPLVQTYCTCLTELNPGTKICASSNFERVL